MKRGKVYYSKDMMKDLKRAQRKVKFKKKVAVIKRWVYDNKEIIIMLAPIVGSILLVSVKHFGRYMVATKQAAVKELYCYDPSLGHYWQLRRKLNNSDWLKINKRKANGEKLGDILESMNVLK